MLVFHGSYTKIEQIDLSIGRNQVDFGTGFYTTTLREQDENNQYCFKTAKSLDYVQFVEAYEVKP